MKEDTESGKYPVISRILRCNCNHLFQDERYGRRMRVHNPTRKSPIPTYKCTVCGRTRSR